MKDLIVYIGLSGICIGIFFLIYRIFLRSSTTFRFNRVFLVVGLIASFILPAMRLSYEVVLPASIGSTSESTTQVAPETFQIDIWGILGIVYLTGIAIQLLRNLASYRKVIKLISSGVLTKTDRYRIVDNPQITSPFTVFNCIAINTKNMSITEKDLILKHEITHISQKHWIDLICSECALLLQWFNPLMWLYVSSQKENHEFLADKAVIEAGISPVVYQAALINQRFQGPVFSFSNSFNYPNQLNRLFMIKKTKTSPWRRVAVLALIPSFGLFFWASATPRYTFKYMEENYSNQPAKPRKDSIVMVAQFPINSNTPIHIVGSKTEGTNNTFQIPEIALYIIDGKESTLSEMQKLDPNDIAAIDVLKDQTSANLYGEKGKNGVVLITTKKGAQSPPPPPTIVYDTDKAKGKPTNIRLSLQSNATPDVSNPIFFLDGKEITNETLQTLDTDKIEKMEVFKGDDAVNKYGEKGKNGVIEITLKK